jgi:hypothetical protein
MRTKLSVFLCTALLLAACDEDKSRGPGDDGGDCAAEPTALDVCGTDSRLVTEAVCDADPRGCSGYMWGGATEYCGKTYYCSAACGWLAVCIGGEPVTEDVCLEAGDECTTVTRAGCDPEYCIPRESDAGDDAN